MSYGRRTVTSPNNLPTTPANPDPSTHAPALIDVGTQALINNATRLGLSWNMTTATITSGTNPTRVLALADGDTVPIVMQSMIGSIATGTRVFVIQVLTTGTNYVAGICGSGQWNTWPVWPTNSGISEGDGRTVTQFRQVGKTVDWYFSFRLGSTSTVTSGPKILLPVPPNLLYFIGVEFPASVSLHDFGTTNRQGSLFYDGSTWLFRYWDGTPALQNITTSAPWTWAVNDSFQAWGTYQAQ